jgi:hypothetical protein
MQKNSINVFIFSPQLGVHEFKPCFPITVFFFLLFLQTGFLQYQLTPFQRFNTIKSKYFPGFQFTGRNKKKSTKKKVVLAVEIIDFEMTIRDDYYNIKNLHFWKKRFSKKKLFVPLILFFCVYIFIIYVIIN